MTKFWKLDSPKMCRDFLKSVRIGPDENKIEFLEQEDGKRITLDDASDDQIMQVAAEIAEAIELSTKNRPKFTH